MPMPKFNWGRREEEEEKKEETTTEETKVEVQPQVNNFEKLSYSDRRPEEKTVETRDSLWSAIEEIVKKKTTIDEVVKQYPEKTQQEIRDFLTKAVESYNRQLDSLFTSTSRVLDRENNRRVLVKKIEERKQQIQASTKERNDIDAEIANKKREFDEYMNTTNAKKQKVVDHIKSLEDDKKIQEGTLEYLLKHGEMPAEGTITLQDKPNVKTESI